MVPDPVPAPAAPSERASEVFGRRGQRCPREGAHLRFVFVSATVAARTSSAPVVLRDAGPVHSPAPDVGPRGERRRMHRRAGAGRAREGHGGAGRVVVETGAWRRVAGAGLSRARPRFGASGPSGSTPFSSRALPPRRSSSFHPSLGRIRPPRPRIPTRYGGGGGPFGGGVREISDRVCAAQKQGDLNLAPLRSNALHPPSPHHADRHSWEGGRWVRAHKRAVTATGRAS